MTSCFLSTSRSFGILPIVKFTFRELRGFYYVVFDHYTNRIEEIEWLDFSDLLCLQFIFDIPGNYKRHVSNPRPDSEQVTCLSMWFFVELNCTFHQAHPLLDATDKLEQQRQGGSKKPSTHLASFPLAWICAN